MMCSYLKQRHRIVWRLVLVFMLPAASFVICSSGCNSSASGTANEQSATTLDATVIDDQLKAYDRKLQSYGGQVDMSVNLARSTITDDDLAQLPLLENVRELDLSFTNITDAGIAHLARAKRLKRLSLIDVSITDAALEHLRDLPELEHVDLHRTQVSTAANLAFIKHLRQQTHERSQGQ